MGLTILQENFTAGDHARYMGRLRDNLRALELMLQRPGFGIGEPTIGAELELSLVDEQRRPAGHNQDVLDLLHDPTYTLELNRYNLEFNAPPLALGGDCLDRLEAQLLAACGRVREAAAGLHVRPVAVGILPTLTVENLGPEAMSPVPRYRALNNSIRSHRHRPFQIHIDGPEPLRFDTGDVTCEGANTSLQIHLRVLPEDFSRVYNAAQLAAGPVLALAGNSPLFLGHRLWEETRIAVFKQSTDDRDADAYRRHRAPRVCFGTGWLHGNGVLEYFSENLRLHAPLIPACSTEDALERVRAGDVPSLGELRLHNSTVWRWNRAVYDSADGGHLRIEFRMLPAGPSVIDMVANAACLLGLCLAVAEGPLVPERDCLFDAVHDNFYRAAQSGLHSVLTWPDGNGGLLRLPAPDLLARLLPLAGQGLIRAGVAEASVRRYLQVLEDRLLAQTTGARWQTKQLAMYEARSNRPDALAAMLTAYIDHADRNLPVSEWKYAA